MSTDFDVESYLYRSWTWTTMQPASQHGCSCSSTCMASRHSTTSLPPKLLSWQLLLGV